MGRIRYSGSPVARASVNTTTEMLASATRAWRRRAKMKRSIVRAVCRLEQEPQRLVLNGGERRRSSLMPLLRLRRALGADHARAYLPEARTSKKRSYITLPTFHLPSDLDVADVEGRKTTGTAECPR